MRLALIFIIALGSTTLLQGQNLEAKTYLEQTHISPKFGTSIGFSFQDEIEVGGFYQRTAVMAEPESGRPLRAENEFYGAYFAYPLMAVRMASVKFNVRTGVSNGENFVITPSVQANFSPIKNISIGGGVGTRSFRPTYMATLTIKMGKQSGRTRYMAKR